MKQMKTFESKTEKFKQGRQTYLLIIKYKSYTVLSVYAYVCVYGTAQI